MIAFWEICFGIILGLAGTILIRDGFLYLNHKKKTLYMGDFLAVKFLQLIKGSEVAKQKAEQLTTGKKLKIYGIEGLVCGVLSLVVGVLMIIDGAFPIFR